MIDAQAVNERLIELHGRSVELAKHATQVFPELADHSFLDFRFQLPSGSIPIEYFPVMDLRRNWLEYAGITITDDFGFWNKLRLSATPWPRDTKLIINRGPSKYTGLLTWRPKGDSPVDGSHRAIIEKITRDLSGRPESISAIAIPRGAEEVIAHGHLTAEDFRTTRPY